MPQLGGNRRKTVALCLSSSSFVSLGHSEACHHHVINVDRGQPPAQASVCSHKGPPLITTRSVCVISTPSVISLTHQRLPCNKITEHLSKYDERSRVPTFGLGSPLTLQEKVTGIPSKTL